MSAAATSSTYCASCPPIGFHCGTGHGAKGSSFPSFLSDLSKAVPGFSAAQIFASSPKSFRPCVWSAETKAAVKAQVEKLGIKLFIHAPYIINPCADETKDIETLMVNLLTCGAEMGAEGVVFHVGKSLKLGETEGLRRMKGYMDRVLTAVAGRPAARLLLETCSGQGTEVARHLAVFGALVREAAATHGTAAVGACLDTCHVWAAGYRMEELPPIIEEQIGWEHLGLIHLNDSIGDCGCETDRHTFIGEGTIGAAALGDFCRSVGSAAPLLPFVLETPETVDGSSRLREVAWFQRLFVSY
jgi:deoxyribonuclease-4